MSQGDCSSPHVDLLPRQSQHLLSCHGHDRERLVELPQSNVVLRNTCILQGDGHGESRGGGEVDRCASGVGVTCEWISIQSHERSTGNEVKEFQCRV